MTSINTPDIVPDPATVNRSSTGVPTDRLLFPDGVKLYLTFAEMAFVVVSVALVPRATIIAEVSAR